jgi:murein DD-endopeptidase MepM/ murein hydrolase activator NlpD
VKRAKVKKETIEFSAPAGRELHHAAEVARRHGTPIYIWKNGKVVAEKP